MFWTSAAAMSTLAATAQARFVCPPAHHFIFMHSRQIFVYEAFAAEGLEEMYACAKGGSHGYQLGWELTTSSSGGAGGVSSITFAGPVIAYDKLNDPTDGENSYDFVYVRNLLTGRLMHRTPSVGGLPVKIVVKADGSVAWISAFGYYNEVEVEVRIADKSGARLLDSGARIDPHSLELHGSKLSWVDGGVRRTATLD